MITIACVLRSGPEYRVEHVLALRDGVRRHLKMPHRFNCLSDIAYSEFPTDIEVTPLAHGWPGWWSKIELFDCFRLRRPIVYVDLDTVVVGPLDDIVLGHRFTVLRNFWRNDRIGSGLMAWDTDLSSIYRKFAQNADGFMAEYKTPEKWGDQQFVFDNTPIQPERWQEKHPGRIVSYKRDIVRFHRGKVPAGASVICHHGLPRPWATPLWDRYRAGESLK